MAAFDSVGVIGAGAWGTALATVAARAGRSVTLWNGKVQFHHGVGDGGCADVAGHRVGEWGAAGFS